MLSSIVLGEVFGAQFLTAYEKISAKETTVGSVSGSSTKSTKNTSGPVLGSPLVALGTKSNKSHETANEKWLSTGTSSAKSQKQGTEPKMNVMSQVLNQMLDNTAEEVKIRGPLGPSDGRLGPKIVKFDVDNHSGSFIVSNDRLGLSSQSNFASVRANVCVFKGKWQYEVQLGTKGLMQIGWVTLDTPFSTERGVGDTMDSYSYDGNRVRKWNATAAPYGDSWQTGDIVGCCIDFDDGNISYSRNGKSLGVAFNDIRRGSGLAYFPAASLAFGENLVANFGASPLEFPVNGFLPLQCQKSVEDTKTQLLLTWVDRILHLYPKVTLGNNTASSSTPHFTTEESLTLVLAAQLTFELLIPNIHSAFVVEHRLLPFFAKKLGLPEQISHRDKLTIQALDFARTDLLLDLMWTFLEESEMQNFTERLCIVLMNYFRTNALSRFYGLQLFSLNCLSALATHKRTRRHLIHHLLFEKTKITNFLHTKPLDDEVLEEIIPSPWWEGKSSNNSAEYKEYAAACTLIQENVHQLEAAQIQLLKILMTNTDGTEKRPSSRALFLRKVREILHETVRPGSVVQRPISRAMCVFFRLLKLTEVLWKEEGGVDPKEGKTKLPAIPPAMFYDMSVSYFDFERLGGLANYLFRTFHEEVCAALHVPDYVANTTSSTRSYSDTPMPSFFGLAGMSSQGGASAPVITLTAARSNRSATSRAASTEVQTSDSFVGSADLSDENTEDGSIESGIIGLFQGGQSTPNTQESQTESIPPGPTRSATSSEGGMSTATMGGIPATSLLAGTASGHNVLIPMFTDFHSALMTRDPRLSFFPGGFLNFPNFESRQGPRPKYPFEERSGRDKGAMDIELSLRELLDDVSILFNLGVIAQVEKVIFLRNAMAGYIKSLNAADNNLKDKRLTEHEKAELHTSIGIFTKKIAEQARYMAWIQGALFTKERQQLVVDLLTNLLSMLKTASGQGHLFAFVPDLHVCTLLQLNSIILEYMEPTVPFSNIRGIKPLFRDVAEFTATHFNDSRIVIAETKDNLTLALTSFISNRTMLTALEEMPEASQLQMMKSILRPYENRAWAQSNWLLMRIWQGNGFGFQYPSAERERNSIRAKSAQDDFGISRTIPPLPSPILQAYVPRILMGNQKLATNYIHSVLNQLNWAFSEFVGLLQEIQTAANRPERVYIESRQLKICTTCYELTQALLRVLEMVLTLAPQITTDFSRDSAEPLLARLCALVSQVLNRIGSDTGSFAQVLDAKITGLEMISYFPILAAVSGILVALLRNEIGNTTASELTVTKTLLREPSFQMASLDFLLGQNQHAPPASVFSLRTHVPADLSEVEIQSLDTTIRHLKTWSTQLGADDESISEDIVCTICYAYPQSTTFKPCNHRACRTCIIHHLMNRGDCFFCKGLIEKVIADDGTIIHDIAASAHNSSESSVTDIQPTTNRH